MERSEIRGPAVPQIETVPCGTRTGAVYMAVFISKSEFSFFKKHGAEALEKRMEDARSDPFTLTRPSII